MTQIRKAKAIEILKSLIAQSSSPGSSDLYDAWRRSSALAAKNIFGQDSEHYGLMTNVTTRDERAGLLRSMLHEVETYWEEPNSPPTLTQELDSSVEERATNADPNVIFVVHGRNLGLRDALFRFLRSINLKPLEWSQAVNATRKPNPYVGEVLDAAFSTGGVVVVLMTPDDQARLRTALRKPDDPPFESQLTYQTRPNVLFEAGLAMARSARQTILVQIGTLRPFSDIGGLHIISLDNSTERRQQLAQRLKNAGCEVDLTGTDWHREGDFSLFADKDPEDS